MTSALARWLRPLAWATLVANVVLVVTGGAVRLTGSGLGCPTWPRCTESSFTPHGAMSLHAAIEFGNRLLTFVLVAIAVATFLAAWGSPRRDVRVLAFVLALGIPAQAIIGGVTVLTDLNPWVVSFHLLCSLAMIGLSVLFLHRLSRPRVGPAARGPVVVLAWLVFAAAWVVLYLGTVVTGSGPHAGDEDAVRNGLDPLQVSQLHADVVFLFLGLSIGLYFAVRALGLSTRPLRWLLVVIVLQGAVGFVQYFTDLPVVLVAFHMLGAALVSAASYVGAGGGTGAGWSGLVGAGAAVSLSRFLPPKPCQAHRSPRLTPSSRKFSTGGSEAQRKTVDVTSHGTHVRDPVGAVARAVHGGAFPGAGPAARRARSSIRPAPSAGLVPSRGPDGLRRPCPGRHARPARPGQAHRHLADPTARARLRTAEPRQVRDPW